MLDSDILRWYTRWTQMNKIQTSSDDTNLMNIKSQFQRRKVTAWNKRNARSPGSDKINIKLLNIGSKTIASKTIASILTWFCNKILSEDLVPRELKERYLILFFKKGDKHCSNYRGICVISPMSKLIEKNFRKRFEEEYKRMNWRTCGTFVGWILIKETFVKTEIQKKRTTEFILVILENLMAMYKEIHFGKYLNLQI